MRLMGNVVVSVFHISKLKKKWDAVYTCHEEEEEEEDEELITTPSPDSLNKPSNFQSWETRNYNKCYDNYNHDKF